jgi:3-demethoxyubiquinol 3-hydroxylase
MVFAMLDSLIIEFDKGLRTLFSVAETIREFPGQKCEEPALTEVGKTHSAALMRINHAGEVCAQALYQGQALTCRNPETRDALEKAAREENEHLTWTAHRISELGSHKSLLNPLWYLSSLTLGAMAGGLGDAWSLGFLAETERQVEAHLDHHLSELPIEDSRSKAIVRQMKADEKGHADMADRLGARELPAFAKVAMRLSARLMTRIAYYL